jgi:hypothetical protein
VLGHVGLLSAVLLDYLGITVLGIRPLSFTVAWKPHHHCGLLLTLIKILLPLMVTTALDEKQVNMP